MKRLVIKVFFKIYRNTVAISMTYWRNHLFSVQRSLGWNAILIDGQIYRLNSGFLLWVVVRTAKEVTFFLTLKNRHLQCITGDIPLFHTGHCCIEGICPILISKPLWYRAKTTGAVLKSTHEPPTTAMRRVDRIVSTHYVIVCFKAVHITYDFPWLQTEHQHPYRQLPEISGWWKNSANITYENTPLAMTKKTNTMRASGTTNPFSLFVVCFIFTTRVFIIQTYERSYDQDFFERIDTFTK